VILFRNNAAPFLGCSRGRPVIVCDGGSALRAGWRGEDRERTSIESDRLWPDQDGQARLTDASPPLPGKSYPGDLPAGGLEPSGATGDENESVLGRQKNGSKEQDPAAFGSAERGSVEVKHG